MNSLKSAACAIAFCSSLAAVAPTNASTVSDFDGARTIDTSTNLLWLDLNLAIGSFAYVSGQFGAGGAFEGYRYATQADFFTLLGDADVDPTVYFGPPKPDASALATLIALLGGDAFGSPYYATNGRLGSPDGGGSLRAEFGFLASRYEFVAVGSFWTDDLVSRNFLITDVAQVPLPSAFGLLAAALGAVGLLGRRKKPMAT